MYVCMYFRVTMLSRLLREFLHTILHFVLSIHVAAQTVFCYWRKTKKSYADEVSINDVEKVLEVVPQLNKRLKHLVVVADGEHSFAELARVVIWSLVAGVPYISFQDVTGELKQNEEKLFHEVERNKKGIPGYIKWSKKPDLNGYSSGMQAHTIVVNILTSDDGRPKIVECIKQIARGTITCEKTSETFTAEELNMALANVYPAVPDVDVVLYSGHFCCTNSLSPWHIRLSEFIQLSTDNSISVDDYTCALIKYSKCNQRFGK